MKIRTMILWLAALVILGLVNYAIFQTEQLRTTGQILYMKLAPVDPRSLIQGDYMQLDYAVLRELANTELPKSGQLLIEYNQQGVATHGELYTGEELGADNQIADNKVLINFRNDGWRLRIGAETYFFQEGQAELFEDAEYAELRIGPSGNLVLVGLLDDELNRLGKEQESIFPWSEG